MFEECMNGIFSIIKEVINIIVPLGGLIIAFFGLQTWRKQLKGKTEYELARRLLRSVYKVRNQIARVRNAFMSSGEISTALDEEGIEVDVFDDEYHWRSSSAVYQSRWNYVADATSELEIETLEAEVVWGSEIIDNINPIKECIHKLHWAITMYIEVIRREGSTKSRSEDIQKYERIIYSGANLEKDEYLTGLEESISVLEKALKPKLKL